jgi:hypothetical protein
MKPGRSVIKCGSIARLMEELERKNGGPIKATNMREPHSATHFMGLPVEQHPYIPDNFVIITQNGEVTHIIDLDREKLP